MDKPSTSSDEDQPKLSLMYDGAKWVAPPPPTSGERLRNTRFQCKVCTAFKKS